MDLIIKNRANIDLKIENYAKIDLIIENYAGSGTFYPDMDPELFISDPYLGYNRYITKIILFLL